MTVTLVRTEMIGGGTSYSLYVPRSQVSPNYRGIIVIWRGKEYCNLVDVLVWNNVRYMDRGYTRFQEMQRIEHEVRKGVVLDFARKAFPELHAVSRLSALWCSWFTLPSTEVQLQFAN